MEGVFGTNDFLLDNQQFEGRFQRLDILVRDVKITTRNLSPDDDNQLK